MRRMWIKATAAAILLLALAGLGGYSYFRRSLPVLHGVVEVSGIDRPIDIVRDVNAVPHIFAATKPDALFGLGYVHAQDRLWQMEFQRRIGFGRLSEILGAATLPEDRFLRTVGFGRAARTAWNSLPEEARSEIGAYMSGINGFIADHHGSGLPPEFSLLHFEPEPWSGPDVLVWVKMMAWDLSGNYSLELLRHDLAARVGPGRMAELFPPSPPNGLSILNPRWYQEGDHAASSALKTPTGDRPALDNSWFGALEAGFPSGSPYIRALLPGSTSTEALGSNNWVVDGTMTASGKPILANDPHLGTQIPSLWYLAHLSAGDFDVIGATLPGTPAVAIGRNRFIAWGATNVGADVEDLYEERLDPTGQTAEYRGAQEPLHAVTETISVKGGPPVLVPVRISRHGPLISDAINRNTAEAKTPFKPKPLPPLALRWTALDDRDRSIVAFLKLNEARNWAAFTTALAELSVPSQNFVYADIDGHIGYYAPGQIPIRAHGDGSLPAQGWTGDSEWIGSIPFAELPNAYDPPEHFIVTANNRPAPPPYPYLITVDFPEPYRAERITELVRQRTNLKPDDFRAIQADTLSLHARAILPLLLEHVRPQDSDRQAVDLLRSWNFDARADSPAAAIFEAWFLRLAPSLVGDELGVRPLRGYQGRYSYITRFVVNTLRSGQSQWCDDRRTPTTETCDETVSAALHEAVTTLTRQLGGDMRRWRWDSAHRVVFPHRGFDTVGLLRPLLSRSLPHGGDWSTVDVGAVDADHPFEQHAIASYRQIVDLSPADDSRFLDAVGESGHVLSRHYDDFLDDWRNVRYRPMRMDRMEIDRNAIGHLRLVPK